VSDEHAASTPPSLWRTLAMPVSLVISVFALGFGLLIAVGLDEGDKAAPTTTETQPAAAGAAAFASAGCGGCHTLAAAGSAGSVGPNLDETKLSEEQIAAVVTKGRPGTAMQSFSGSLTPEQIAAVAAYVSASAGSSR